MDLTRYDLQTQAIDLEFSDRAYVKKKKLDHYNSIAEITLLDDQHILDQNLKKFDVVKIEYRNYKEPEAKQLLDCIHGIANFDDSYLDGLTIKKI